MKQQNCKMCYW